MDHVSEAGQGRPIGDRDRAAVQVEPDDLVDDLLLGHEHGDTGVGLGHGGAEPVVRGGRHEHRTDVQRRREQTLDHRWTLRPQHVSALATAQ